MIIKQVHSDCFKLIKTYFFQVHFLIPIAGALLFFGYQNVSKLPGTLSLVYFSQIISLIYPIVIAWICHIVIEQEYQAGHHFYLLSCYSRSVSLFSKLFLIIIFGFLSSIFAILIEYFLNKCFIPNYSVPLSYPVLLAVVTFLCSIFLYIFHFFIELYFGEMIGFSISIFEVLVAALMITDLGKVIWFLFPSSWGIKFISWIFIYNISLRSLVLPISFIVLMMVTITLIIVIWFSKWEGRSED